MSNDKEEVQEIVKKQALGVLKELLKEFAKAPRGGDFRNTFGSTFWKYMRQRPEHWEQTMKRCEV